MLLKPNPDFPKANLKYDKKAFLASFKMPNFETISET
jgi:hypothetical protein